MKRYFLLVLCFIFTLNANAQRPFFKELVIDPQNDDLRATSLCQAANGLIYIGTDKGLYRYDGFNFELLQIPAAINSLKVSTIINGGKNEMIVGFENGGLMRWKNDKAFIIKSPAQSAVRSLFIGAQGVLWMATYGDGIFYRTGKDWHRLAGLPDPFVYQLELHPAGYLIAGTDGGLVVIDPSSNPFSYKIYNAQNGLPDNIVKTIGIQPDGTILLGLQEAGIVVFNLRTRTFKAVHSTTEWKYGAVTCITRLQNEFWLGTDGNGIVDYEYSGDRRLRNFGVNSGFPYSKVSAVLRDSEGNVWIAADHKLILSPGEKVEFVEDNNSTVFDSIQSIAASPDGYIWYSTPKGLYRFDYLAKDNERLIKFKVDAAIHRLHIVSLYEDHDGFLWIGTFDNGLYCMDPATRKVKKFGEKEGLKNANVISIAGTDSVVYLATLGGVMQCRKYGVSNDLNRQTFVFNTMSSKLGPYDGFVYCVYVDTKGRIWFGTDGKGIIMYDGSRFVSYPEFSGGKVVYSITEDFYGNIWFSSQHNGLYRFDGLKFRNFSLAQGLSELDISGISGDNNGNIVAVNTKGLDIINPWTFEIENIGEESGIGKIDADLNAVTHDYKGGVWIGSHKGLLRFFNYNKGLRKKPRLILRRVLTFMKQGVDMRDTVFQYNQNNISIEYSGIWYTHPDLVSYRYRMKGYSNDWIPTRDRIVTFPNLPPGRYTFEIMAGLGGQFKNTEIVAYSFIIKKPLWRENWLIISALILLGLSIFWFLRDREIRFRRLESLKKEKVEYQFATLKSQVNPHFLFNSFNTLIAIIEVDRNKAISYVEKLADYFRNMVQHRDKDLISLEEELEMVETYYFLQQKRFGDFLILKINIPEDWKFRFALPPLSLQLLIENAVKHNAVSFETPLTITVTATDHESLIIANNLNPKLKADPSTGIGLDNIINRFHIVSGQKVIISSVSDKFIIEIPLIKLH